MEIKKYFSLISIMVLLPVHVAFDLYGKCGVKSTTATTLMLLLLMLSCLTCALTPTNEAEITFIECGDIVPDNPHYFIGEKLVLTCAIQNVDNNKTVSLYFETTVNKSFKEVNQTGYEIIQLNSTAIQLTSPVLTIDDAQRHNISRPYKCMVREVLNICTKKSKKVVKVTHVKIDYYPHNPENFSCQVYNWERMTCTWDMIRYFHKNEITVEYFWKSGLLLEDSNIWSSNFSNTFTSFTMDNFNMMPEYWFYFKINNTVRSIVNTSAIFHISPSKIVKPSPVDLISFQNLSDTCVTVVWSHSRPLNQIVFTVHYTSGCSADQQITTQELKETVCDLNPYTNYTFSVDSRPVDPNGKRNSLDTIGFTSDPNDSSVITKSAVPAANPKLLSYTDVPCPERQCRQVLVYWEPLPPCDLHDSPSGQQFEIIVKQRGSEKTWNSAVNDSKAISQPLILPDEGKVYDVKLRVITGSGKMRDDFSQMVIWPKNQSPIAPSMVVEYDTMMNGTHFYITLSLTEAQSQTSQILYWCRGLRGIGCQEAMSFLKINGSSAEIFFQNYVMDLNFQIGVESQQLQSGEITQSGIQIVSCIYRKDQKPLIPPKNFHIAKGIAEREGELSLQWDPYNCNSSDLESGYVLSYTLYYCQVIDESSCDLNHSMLDLNPISIERDIHNYTVRKLKPGGRYKIWLTASTSAGEGPPTDAVDTYIYIQDFPLWGKVMIGIASLIASLVILTCFVKFQQYLKERRKAFSVIEIPVPIDHMHLGHGHVIADDQSDEPIPDMDESEEQGNIIPLIQNGDVQVSMTSDSSSTSLSSDLRPGDGPYIPINDMTRTKYLGGFNLELKDTPGGICLKY